MKSSMTKEFNYVIARPWHDGTNALCSYMMYGGQVLHGTIDDARKSLEYVISQKEDDDESDYQIYKVVPYTPED